MKNIILFTNIAFNKQGLTGVPGAPGPQGPKVCTYCAHFLINTMCSLDVLKGAVFRLIYRDFLIMARDLL